METIEELRASRSRVLELLCKARTKLFEQDEVIQELRDENDAQRKTIGQLRANIAWIHSRDEQRKHGAIE